MCMALMLIHPSLHHGLVIQHPAETKIDDWATQGTANPDKSSQAFH